MKEITGEIVTFETEGYLLLACAGINPTRLFVMGASSIFYPTPTTHGLIRSYPKDFGDYVS